jgi:hypothetical protein
MGAEDRDFLKTNPLFFFSATNHSTVLAIKNIAVPLLCRRIAGTRTVQVSPQRLPISDFSWRGLSHFHIRKNF